jgi:antitoxin (DNA-binding transcriptional repressor) of toxin-antitoxin stability system
MTSINLDDAKARLGEIISRLNPGEQLVIVQNGEPLALLTRNRPRQWPCAAGSAKDTKHRMAPDFDAPLEEFREYME